MSYSAVSGDGYNVLEVKALRTRMGRGAGSVTAVDGVGFSIERGQTVALVGESGCGKTVTALSVMRLIPRRLGSILGGEVLFRDGPGGDRVNLLALDERSMCRIRGARISMVFQEPSASLNPVQRVGKQIVEVLRLHRRLPRRRAWTRATELLDRMGIADAARRARAFPHQLSGGMQQRVMIAMALACEPALLIADEPTSALDVTIQAQIMELLMEQQRAADMAMLLITHDMGVVARMADHVCVMSAGKVLESAAARRVLTAPQHCRTQRLLRCTPRLVSRGGPTDG